jgi:hypothetical protein
MLTPGDACDVDQAISPFNRNKQAAFGGGLSPFVGHSSYVPPGVSSQVTDVLTKPHDVYGFGVTAVRH